MRIKNTALKLLSKLLPFFICVSTFILLTYAASSSAGLPGDKFIELSIIHTNDTHGNFQEIWKNGRSDVSTIASLKNEIMKKNENNQILLLDAGDIMNHQPNLELMASDLEAMSKSGYDAVALGNHDVKIGLYKLNQLSQKLNLPVVCANLVYKDTNDYVFKPYIIKDIGGVKIGILGFTTPETIESMNSEDSSKVTILKPEKAYSIIIDKFKSECDVRIVLSHLGTDEDMRLAKTHQKLSIIVGGHTPDAVKEPEFIESSAVVNTGKFGINVGRLNVTLDTENLEIKSINGDLFRVGDKSEL